MKLLSFECSAKSASVAVSEDGKLLCEVFENVGRTHSDTLLPMAEFALRCCSVNISDIDGFAVAVGPGSFTGLRIGISAVKGLSISGEKPCAGVSTLKAMAYGALGSGRIIASVMDARCSQCYCALFLEKDEKIERISPDEALPMEQLYDKIKKAIKEYECGAIILGDGAELFMRTYGEGFSENEAILMEASRRHQSAKFVALEGFRCFSEGKTVSSAELLPTYLRLPQAERELKRRNEEKK